MDNVPDFELSEEQREFRNELKQFVNDELVPLNYNEYEWRDDPNERIPWHIVEKADQELGLRSLTVPEEFGGYDASPLTVTLAAEELSYGDMGFAVIFDQTWKFAKVINELASGDLRNQFFKEFMDDSRYVLAATMTEKDHGSDNLLPDEANHQLDTTAEKDGDEWVINGHKRYISNGADAKTYLVYAQTDPNALAVEGTSAFMVPSDAAGVEVTNIHEKISQRMINNATLEFHNVRVSDARLLGEPGRGMESVGSLLKESHTEAAATALGTARRAFEEALAYSKHRVQGGTEIINHQTIGHDLAQIATELQAARALTWMVARAIEDGEYTKDMGSMAKVHASEVAFDVSKRALEKFGGEGIMLESPQQKYFRDALSFLHSDGTVEVHKEKVIQSLRDQSKQQNWRQPF